MKRYDGDGDGDGEGEGDGNKGMWIGRDLSFPFWAESFSLQNYTLNGGMSCW